MGRDIPPDVFGVDNQEPDFAARQASEIDNPNSTALPRPGPGPSNLSAPTAAWNNFTGVGVRGNPGTECASLFFGPKFSGVGDEGWGFDDCKHEKDYTS